MASPALSTDSTHATQVRDHSTPMTIPGGRRLTWCARPHRYDDSQLALDPGTLFGRLSLDWTRLVALPDTSVTLAAWEAAEPDLAAAAAVSLPALMDVIDRAAPAVTDRLLAALLRVHQSGDQVAGQMLLMQMLPGLAKLARRPSATGAAEDERGEVVAAFWEVISSHRCDAEARSLAAGLTLTTLRKLTGSKRRPERVEVPSGRATGLSGVMYLGRNGRDSSAGAMFRGDEFGYNLGIERAAKSGPTLEEIRTATSHPNPDMDLLTLLAWAADTQAISLEEVRLLARVYCPSEGQSRASADVAEELGLSATAVRARCSRAVRRLAAAVRSNAETDTLPQRPDVSSAASISDTYAPACRA